MDKPYKTIIIVYIILITVQYSIFKRRVVDIAANYTLKMAFISTKIRLNSYYFSYE